ncbi:hypothetical protein [Pseudomonas corrugata]
MPGYWRWSGRAAGRSLLAATRA